MIQSPITRVLSSMQKNGVDCLLMGGQACILYGGAEFSRDIDFVLHVSAENIKNLKQVITELEAECIAVPPFEISYLQKGHAIHFRCQAPGVERLRIDVMSRLPSLDSFELLWSRRTSIDLGELQIELLSLPDLIVAKRTQRDKDWLMTNRLVEAHYLENKKAPTRDQIIFWLTESYDLELLAQWVTHYPEEAAQVAKSRNAIDQLLKDQLEEARRALNNDKKTIIKNDQQYWEPLKKELGELRRKK